MAATRMAVIGVGALGRHHARILSSLDDVELVGVADVNRRQAEEIARQYDCEATTDYHTLLERVDAVSVVVPTTHHERVACDFLEAGAAVLVEKPLAVSVGAGRNIVRAAAARDLPLAVGHVERFNPAYEMVKALAGRPRYLRTERVSPFAFRSMDIGVVHDLMIHDIDLALDLADSRPARVEAFGVSLLGRQEDAALARLSFENGGVADLSVNRVHPVAGRTIQAWSESGCVTADLTSRQCRRLSPSEELRHGNGPLERFGQPGVNVPTLKQELFERDFQIEAPAVSDADALTAELAQFVECVRTECHPRVSGRAALAALEVAERVLECIDSHQWDGDQQGPVGPMAFWPAPATIPLRKAA